MSKSSADGDFGDNTIISFAPFAAWSPHFETDLEIIQNHLDEGGNAILLSCNGDLKICEPNPSHDLLFCAMCKGRLHSGLKWLNNPRVQHSNFKNITKCQQGVVDEIAKKKWSNFEEVRQFTIDSADIGLSAASSIISLLRETNPDVHLHQEVIRRHVVTAATVFFSIQNHLLKFRPKKLVVFNGRFSSVRPAMRAAQLLSVRFDVHERASDIDKFNIFENTYPHNLQANKEKIEEHYLKSSINQDDAWRITVEWFEQRRSGIDQIWPSLIKSQKKGLLPELLSSDFINVVIFNSSDDEYAACNEWNMRFHADQTASIDALMKDVGKNPKIRVFLRVHPMLRGIQNTQTDSIKMLSLKYKTLHVIPAESPVHTYSLVDASDVVITYGSTVGIEASYAGKVSILMGRAVYEDLDVVIKPDSHAKLVEILLSMAKGHNPELPCGRKLGYIKFVLYSLYHGESFNYVLPTGLFSTKMLKDGRICKIKANPIIWFSSKISTFLKKLFVKNSII